MRVVDGIYKLKYFIFCQQKTQGKMARTQGKHGEFGIVWSVATLTLHQPIISSLFIWLSSSDSLFVNLSFHLSSILNSSSTFPRQSCGLNYITESDGARYNASKHSCYWNLSKSLNLKI